MKSNKKIIGLGAVIILTVLLFFFLAKSQSNNTNNANKNNGAVSSEELKDIEVSKNDGKTPVGNAEGVPSTTGETKTNTGDKATNENDKTSSDISNEHGITVFVKGANFGSTAEIVIDSSKFNKNVKYYQFYTGNKPVSKIESITILETTIFPAHDAGSEVVIHLLDGNQKEINKVDIKLVEKK